MTIKMPTDQAFATFGKQVAALLGTQLEWNGGDCLEEIALRAIDHLGVSIGDQNDEELHFWRALADKLGVYYEEEDRAGHIDEITFDTDDLAEPDDEEDE